MALGQADLRRLAAAIEFLARAALVNENPAVVANLEKAQWVINNILQPLPCYSKRKAQEKEEG